MSSPEDAQSSHSPFPDVTGLRTSGPGFSRSNQNNEFITSRLDTDIPTRGIAIHERHLGLERGDLILAAWAGVLYHYVSHETQSLSIASITRPSSSPPSTTYQNLVQLEFSDEQFKSLDARSFLGFVSERRKRALPTVPSGFGSAGIYWPTREGKGKSMDEIDEIKQNQFRSCSLILAAFESESGSLSLVIKASPSVHTESSALLQLEQANALLASLIQDLERPSLLPALSMQRFDISLKACDNPDFQHLPPASFLEESDTERLECEFEHYARTRPDEVALDFRYDLQDVQRCVWTYREMNERAEAVKHILWSKGVGSAAKVEGDQIVALYLEKSPETYLSFLSVIKAGAAWCPIDTDWPAARRKALLAKSGAKIVLTANDAIAKNLAEDIEDLEMEIVRLDRIADLVEALRGGGPSSANPAELKRRSPDQLAYMIWTSGTTGLPKGVGIQHSAILQAMRALREAIPYKEQDTGSKEIRYLQYSAYNFDLSIMDCFYVWGLGGTLCSCSRALLLQDLVEIANVFEPTHTLLTPAVMAMTDRHSIPSLKVVINGGEKLSQVVADEWSKECCLLNLYGPAEATLIAMNRRVPMGDRVKAPNIGVALPTVSCYALDKYDSIVVKGAVGELVLGGPQLARGYVGDPVKTADKFFQHPQLGRVYRTGDLVRQLSNQEFEYLGRIDDQVKINGIRIELLEINAAIKNSHEKIKDSETMAFPRPGSETELQIINLSVLPYEGGEEGVTPASGLIRTDPDAVTVARSLQQAAKSSLPSYMMPSMFLILCRFPRTSSAKIDRVALKNAMNEFDSLEWENKLAGSDSDDDESGTESDPKVSAAQECMRQWLAKLCDVAPERIGKNTGFPSIGLDSIRAITFAQRVSKEGFRISVVDVIEHPTLSSLSKRFAASSGGEGERRAEEAARYLEDFDRRYRTSACASLGGVKAEREGSEISDILPCAPLQQGMLAESQRDPLAYRVHRLYRLNPKVDWKRLRETLKDVVRNLDCLRTSFVDAENLELDREAEMSFNRPHFLQVVWKNKPIGFHTLELGLQDELETSILEYVKNLNIDPFGSQPPVAALSVSQGAEKWLVLVAHHAVYDGRSLAIVEEMIEKTYSSRGELPEICQFKEALPLILPINAEEEMGRRRIWETALEAFPRGELPSFPNLSGTSRTASEEESRNLHRSCHRLASVAWSEVEKTARRMGISTRPLVQVAWAKVISAYLETDHVLIGDSVSGRNAAAFLENVVGPVLSTLPIPILIKQGRSLREIAKSVDAFQRKVFSAQHVDLGAIRRDLGCEPGQALFHSVFVMEPKEVSPEELEVQGEGRLGLVRVKDLGVATEHAIGVEVQPGDGDAIQIGLSWQESLISDQVGKTMLEQFDAYLKACVTEVDSVIPKSLSYGTCRDELLSISKEDVHPSIEHALGINVASFVDQKALANRIAVEVYPEIPEEGESGHRAKPRQMTYKDLAQSSSKVANLLESLPEKAVVAVCLPRSLESYTFLAGILKSGRTYLPLDATLPAERKRVLLQDSGAACIVSTLELGEDLKDDKVEFLDVESEDFQARLARSSSTHVPRANSDDVAFIIYTSGSTGVPKGCLVTYGNLSVSIEAFRLAFEAEAPGSFEDSPRFLARSSEAFDVHLLEIFLSFKVGATIVTAPRPTIHEDLGRSMARLRVTHACVVPSLFFSQGKRVGPADLPEIRVLVIGGEALTPDLIQLWGSSPKQNAPVALNAYGPSEATIGNSVARIHKDSISSNVGKPFSGTRYMVLKEVDSKLVPTLRGEPGELCIGGLQVSKGYLNRPELDSFTFWEGMWIYRTGDMARLNAFDEAEYLGRMDQSQVKVRGARLELGEVDSAVKKVKSEEDGSDVQVVTIHSDHPQVKGPARLISFICDGALKRAGSKQEDGLLIVDDEVVKQLARLRKAVRSKLPHYMTPSVLLAVRNIPISPLSGKVDVKTLKAFYQGLDVSQLDALESRDSREMTTDESEVAKVTSEVLRLEGEAIIKIHADTDLISLGLDSLSVVSLANRLKKRGFNVNASTLLKDPTVEAIALRGKIDQALPEVDPGFQDLVRDLTEKARLIDPRVVKAMPCLPLQVALLAQSMSSHPDDQGSPKYVTTIVFDMLRETNADLIQKAWIDSLAPHEIYRTIFLEVDKAYCQAILPEFGAKFETINKSCDREETISDYHSKTSRQVAESLGSVPPIRLALWKGEDKVSVTLTCSHAIYDGVSISGLLQEVEARLRGAKIKVVPTPFSDVVRAIHSLPERETREYWIERLQGSAQTPSPNLTGFRGREPTPGSVAAGEMTLTSKHLRSTLERAARGSGVTLHTLTLSAFTRLLACYAGEDDITLGLVLSGRTLGLEGIDRVQGPCVTTVPFRTINARNSASDDVYLKETQKGLTELLPHQHVSLPQLMKWLELEKPPFEVLFSYLGEMGSGQGHLGEVRERTSLMEKEYPLALEVSLDGQDELKLHLAFAKDRIPNEHAEMLLKQLDHLIGLLSGADPDDGLRRLPEELLSAVNSKPYVPSSASETFIARFKSQVAKIPDSVAVVFTESLDQEVDVMTYKELDQLSDNIARNIVSVPDEIVGVHLARNSINLYPAILAVWKAGKTYLPLDPTLPKDRLNYMISTVGKAPVITTEDLSQSMRDASSKVFLLDEVIKPTPVGRQELPEASLDSNAYLLFTSGSTGKPKGVVIPQRGLSGAIYSWERMLPWSSKSRFLQLASIGFDVSLIEICMPLALGFSFGSAPKEVLIEDLTRSINHLGVTIADLPAALAGTVHPDDVDLEWLMSGGDAIDPRVIKDWTSADRILINAWGPTETTIGSSLGRVLPGMASSVVGKAYPACSLYILEEGSLEPAFKGAVGEIAVGGPQLAQGYFGRDDLTCEKFVSLTESNGDCQRVYRTGDLGRLLADGTLECLGRIESDRQVKVNGQRVELEEISRALVSDARVKDADVQYIQHPSFTSKQLVAFLALDKAKRDALDHPKDPSEAIRRDAAAVELTSDLEQEVSKTLSPYMIPAHWIVLKGELPLTPNNKVDHKALKALFDGLRPSDLQSFGSQREERLSKSPWTVEEESLREILSDFCNVPREQILRTTSIHRLGIDSITAIRLVKRLKSEGFKLSVADLMSVPYVGSLASKHAKSDFADKERRTIERARGLQERILSKPEVQGWTLFEDDNLVSVLPCTPLQSGMISQTLASQGKLYYHHHAFKTTGMVDLGSVRAAWSKLVSHLDILRTTFHSLDDQDHPWVQAVHSRVEPVIVEHARDLQGLDDPLDLDQIEGALLTLTDEACFKRPPHSLHVWGGQGSGPLLVVLSIHHALYDGYSLPLLLRDFSSILATQETKRRPEFHRLVPHLLPDDEDTRYWTERLGRLATKSLAGGEKRSSKEVSSTKASESDRRLSISLKRAQEACRKMGVSLQVAASVAYAKLLAIETGSRDVCFGQIFGLRDSLDDAMESVGPALNTVPTRLRFESDDVSASDQLLKAQRENDSGRPHRKAALRSIQRCLLVERGIESRLFDSLFDFQKADGLLGDNKHADEEEVAPLRPVEIKGNEGAPQYSLNVEFVEGAEHLALVATADPDVLSQDRLDRLLARLEAIFDHLISNPDERIVSLPSGESGVFPDPTDPAIQGEEVDAVKALGAESGDRDPESERLNEDEVKLAEIISEASNVALSELRPTSRLSSLGLDSISAIRIAASARRSGIAVGVADIVAGETIRGIMSRVESKRRPKELGPRRARSDDQEQAKTVVAEQLSLGKKDIERVLPTLAGQEFWLANWLNSGRRTGIFSFAFLARERIDRERLKTSWARLVARHEILRTAFTLYRGEPVQVVLEERSLDLPWNEVEVVGGGEDLVASTKATVEGIQAESWDCSRPPLRLTLISSQDGESQVILVTLHHALYDDVSIRTMFKELEDMYLGREEVLEAEIPTERRWSSFVEKIKREKEEKDASERSQRFWQGCLSGGQVAILGSSRTSEGEEEEFLFAQDVLKGLGELEEKAKQKGTKLTSLLIAAWSAVLSSMTGLESPLFGLYQLARSSDFDGIEELVGPCLNVLPFRVEPPPSSGKPEADLCERSKSVTDDLRRRAEFEQDHLGSVLAPQEVRFNTYLNLLVPTQDPASKDQGRLRAWQTLPIGPPKPSSTTSTDGNLEKLPRRHPVRPDLNVDLSIDRTKDSISIAVKARNSKLLEPFGGAPALVRDLVRVVLGAV
ncbi:acetyl-CoA synthetase-like protein [Violaceomyces palustris]|uniref:Acetyl-CoA synthetase-like protein n=1 Tax=Violaceomyces palustris TaxID=1673888 RepID=A0ACD0NRK7_9BASI|nr:acetyl-CoA synthetase-like protein [Violaceomyces palustris]